MLAATCLMFRRITRIRTDCAVPWRPSVAALAVLPLLRCSTWATLSPIVAVCVGGALVVFVYFVCLTFVGGLSQEVRGRLTRRDRSETE